MPNSPAALITGASRGLGLALAKGLAQRDWSLVIDGRDSHALARAADELTAVAGAAGATIRAIAGDVTQPDHRQALVDAASALGGIDALVNNAGALGPSPLPSLSAVQLSDLRLVLEANAIAPIGLVQQVLPLLRRSGRPLVLNVTSDAAVVPYEGWGVYGSSKAALELLGSVLAVEEPWLRVLTVDPGDMRTEMHQFAFPGEDISDRPDPAEVVPALVELIEGSLPSGRYRAADIPTAARDRDAETPGVSPAQAVR